jgi:long-subunit acyl-CoA synthetase (AMP-forming)
MDLVSWTFSSPCADIDKPVRRNVDSTCTLSNHLQLLIDPSNTSRALTYRELRSYVRKLVAGLRAVGVQEGDCVCVSSFNDVRYLEISPSHPTNQNPSSYILRSTSESSALEVNSHGFLVAEPSLTIRKAAFTGVNPAYTAHELVHHLQLTRPKVLLVEPHLLKPALEAAQEVGLPESSIYLFDVFQADDSALNANFKSWERLLEHGEEDWVVVENPDQAVAQYASTSGTSGLPKAALLPHSYHVSQATMRLTDDSLPYSPRRLTALPPFHVFATPIVPSSIRQGIPTYIMRRHDMQSYLEYIQKFEITETYLPPPVLVGMPLSPFCSKEGLRSLRQIWFGGASLRYGNQVPLYTLLHPDAKIQPVWGMTEAGWITAGTWPDKFQDDSAGKALPIFQVK